MRDINGILQMSENLSVKSGHRKCSVKKGVLRSFPIDAEILMSLKSILLVIVAI